MRLWAWSFPWAAAANHPGPSVSELVKVADDQGSEGAGNLMSGNSGSYRTARFGTWVETERVLSGRARKQRTECEGRFVPPVASSVLDVAKPKRVTAAFVPVVVVRYPQIDCAEASMYDRIFLLSQSFIPAVNALLIGSLIYQLRLVPRWLPLVGFTGANPARRFRRRRALRSDRGAWCNRGVRNPDRGLGVFAGRVFGRQRLQALGHRPLRPTCRSRRAIAP